MGALEGAWQITTGKLVSLSEQQLVDCAKDAGDGCYGGWMSSAFQYLEGRDVCTEESYAYTARNGQCQQSGCTAGIPSGGVVGYKSVASQDENALMEAVAQQPVAVAIEADEWSFQSYSSGVLTKSCGSSLDHGVLAVGYGTDNGVAYWKVKNSWGSGWGDQGYVRLERGLPGAGECGIKLSGSYPVVQQMTESTIESGTPSRGLVMFPLLAVVIAALLQ